MVFEIKRETAEAVPPVSSWYDAVGNPTITDAILDRIVHNAHRIEFDGDSLCKIGVRK